MRKTTKQREEWTMDCNSLMALRVADRDSSALKIQEVLTKHGCQINMRLGLHDTDGGNVCSSTGTMILRLCCPASEAKEIEAALVKIPGVKAKFIDLE